MTVSFDLSAEDIKFIEAWKGGRSINVSDIARQLLLDRIEDEMDLRAYREARAEYEAAPVTDSHGEVGERLGYQKDPFFSESTVRANQANAVKQSVEAATDGLIIVNLVSCSTQDEWLYTSYYTDNGYEMNGELSTTSGWAPDYGDPKTYLSTLVIEDDGYMLSNIGMFGH